MYAEKNSFHFIDCNFWFAIVRLFALYRAVVIIQNLILSLLLHYTWLAEIVKDFVCLPYAVPGNSKNTSIKILIRPILI